MPVMRLLYACTYIHRKMIKQHGKTKIKNYDFEEKKVLAFKLSASFSYANDKQCITPSKKRWAGN